MNLDLDEIRKFITIVLLCLINTLNYMDRYIIFGILSQIQCFYNLGNGQAGLLQTVFLASYILFSFLIGIFGDWVSRKYFIVIGVVFWSIFSLFGSFVPHDKYALFYLSRGLIGIGEATISTLGFTVIGDLYTGTPRTRSLSFFLAATPVGSGLGYLLGPQIASATGSWQWALRLTPFLGFIFAPLLLIVMKEPKRGQAEIEERNQPDLSITHSSSQNTSVNSTPSFLGDNFFHDNFLYFIIRKSFVTITLGYTGISFVFGGLGVWAPQYIELITKHFNAQSNETSNERFVGLVFGVTSMICGFFGVILGGEITAFFRKRNRPIEIYMCIACCLASAISLYLCIYLSLISLTFTWITMCITLLFLCLMWSPNGDLLMLVVGPLHRSRGSAIQIFSIHALGDAISPLIIGYVSDHLKEDNSDWWKIKSLYQALYMTPFFLLFAAILYIISLFFYQKDNKRTINETTQLLEDMNLNPSLQTTI